MKSPETLWTPSPAFSSASNMAAYMAWLEREKELPFGDYHRLWQWSVERTGDFWESIRQYYRVMSSSPWRSALTPGAEGIFGTRWFEGAEVNYAEHIFRNSTDKHPALLFRSERHALQEISWKELEQQVASVAAWLKAAGVEKGDRVAGFLPNVPQAVVAFLATNAIGAVWSGCSPDFGTASVIERFQQIEPKVLFTADGYSYNGRPFDRREAVRELLAALQAICHTIILPYLDAKYTAADIPGALLWEEVAGNKEAALSFERVPFAHPMWVLYSSGTTGRPKAITHSQGGMLLEHLKALGLHQDCRPGDRFFWYSTTGWMMWNYSVAALLHGATVVIYDGSAGYPDLHVLWDLAREAGINHFGGGAAFYIACMKKGLKYGGDRFPALRSLGSTGSPLPPEAFEWIYKAVKKDLWLVSLSGGTDICSGFVGGSPLLPVYKGEIQCRMLGCSVEAWNEEGTPVVNEVGEMVVTKALPSMPVYFWNDEGDARYRASYFGMYPGVWRHGDWLKITERNTLVIYGRSDATLNRGGVRIGTSEVYNAVESMPEVADSMVLSIEHEGGEHWMPLFVVPAQGQALTDELKKKICDRLRTMYSPRHVPDEILQADAIPYTISGKKMEAPVKKILMGMPPDKAASRDAMKNPEALGFFVKMAGRGK